MSTSSLHASPRRTPPIGVGNVAAAAPCLLLPTRFHTTCPRDPTPRVSQELKVKGRVHNETPPPPPVAATATRTAGATVRTMTQSRITTDTARGTGAPTAILEATDVRRATALWSIAWVTIVTVYGLPTLVLVTGNPQDLIQRTFLRKKRRTDFRGASRKNCLTMERYVTLSQYLITIRRSCHLILMEPKKNYNSRKEIWSRLFSIH